MSYVRSTWSSGVGAVAAGDIKITVTQGGKKTTTTSKPSWYKPGVVVTRSTPVPKPSGRGPLFVKPSQIISTKPARVLLPGTPVPPTSARPAPDVPAPSSGGGSVPSGGGGSVPSGGGGGGGGGGGTPMPPEPMPEAPPSELEELEPIDPEMPIETTPAAITEKKPMSTAAKLGLGVGAGLLLLSMFSK